MSLVYLTEGERRSADAWQRDLGLDQSTWEELFAQGVFTSVRGGLQKDISLNFVGFVGLPESLLTCMPRVGIKTGDAARWLRRVLAAYFGREGRRSREDAAVDLHYRDSSVFREIDALETLMGIYSDRGLYRRSVTSSTIRGSGAIDWSGTLAQCEPIISNGQPIYVEPRRWQRRAETNEISRLQAAVTVWLARRFQAPLHPGLLEAVGGMDVEARMSTDRAELDLLLLARERAVTYLTGDLRLLNVLEAVISGHRKISGIAGAKLYGTTSFALVWEDALRDLFGDDAEGEFLGQANWYDLEGGVLSAPKEAPARRLDLLIRNGNEILLLDAKYHFPFPLSRPGWADIIKQVYYAETIVQDAGGLVRNGFLLPRAGRALALASVLRIEQAARAFPPIEAWTADPTWVFSDYGTSDMRRRTRARQIFAAARDEVAEVLR